MAELLMLISAAVGIAAGVCTILGYAEGRARGTNREGGGRRESELLSRERTLPRGPGDDSGPKGVEGVEEKHS